MIRIIIIAVVIGAIGLFLFNQSGSEPVVALGGEGSVSVAAALTPEKPKVGEEVTLTFTFTKENGEPANDLMRHHGRKVHVLLIPENFASIGHIHPADFINEGDAHTEVGTYSVQYTFPEAGRYIAAVDVMNDGGATSRQFAITVGGEPRMTTASEPSFTNTKCFAGVPEQGSADRYVDPVFLDEVVTDCSAGYQVHMMPSVNPITAGEMVALQYHVSKGGEPVTDLEPYLNAALHLAIVPQSHDTVMHRHGVAIENIEEVMGHKVESGYMDMESTHGATGHDEDSHMSMEADTDNSTHDAHGHEGGHHATLPETFGPGLASERLVFPRAGTYHVFGQFKHEGKIVFSTFTVEVEPSFDESQATLLEADLTERTLTPETITVLQGGPVILSVMSDETGDFHITGYDIESPVVSGETREVRFTANQAGRYLLELHPEGSNEDVIVGALVVNPR